MTSPDLATSSPPTLSLRQPLLTPIEAAHLLSVEQSWIYDAVRCGTLPCVRIGRHIRFTQTMLEAWLHDRCT